MESDELMLNKEGRLEVEEEETGASTGLMGNFFAEAQKFGRVIVLTGRKQRRWSKRCCGSREGRSQLAEWIYRLAEWIYAEA